MSTNSKIVLGEQQKEALEAIKDFLHSNKKVFSLVGYAGTGKSTMIKEVIDYVESKHIQYILCAPTHKAKSVVMFNTDRDAYTIHQVLKLSPKLDIMELDLRDLMFIQSDYKALELPFDGVLICDESSMVNDVLFNLLLEKCSKFNTKIIFVGDKAQLKPVNEDGHSLVFHVKDLYELTYIYRQDDASGLSSILPILRKQIIRRFTDSVGKTGSLLCKNNAKDLFYEAIPSFKKAIKNGDIFEAKMLAYTNARVEAFNNKMRSMLFNPEKEYCEGELLTAYENFEFNFHSYWNSMDYIIVDKPKETSIKIPYFVNVPGHKINLYDFGSGSTGEVFILSKDIPKMYLDSLVNLIEETRLAAIDMKTKHIRGSGKLWQKYYQITESFASPFNLIYDNRVIKKKTFDYGYACTIHKSQGSSINNVFIDMKDASVCRDKEEYRQLQYVSVSRARQNAYILQ